MFVPKIIKIRYFFTLQSKMSGLFLRHSVYIATADYLQPFSGYLKVVSIWCLRTLDAE